MLQMLMMMQPLTKRRLNASVIWMGKRWTLTELASEYHINRSTLYSRIIERGWSVDRALREPDDTKRRTNTKKARRLYSYRGKEYSLTELCKMSGLSMTTLATRLSKGMSVQDAMEKPVNENKSRKGPRKRL